MAHPTFAAELKTWRHNLRLSQSGACQRLGVPLRTLQEWEQGRRQPTHVHAIRQLMDQPPLPRRKRSAAKEEAR